VTDSSDAAALAQENAALRARVAEFEQAAAQHAADAELLRGLLAAVPAFIIHIDAALRVRFVNRYLPGLTPEGVLGRSAFDFIAPQDHERSRQFIEQARATGQIVSYPTLAVGPHGAAANYENYVAPVREADGSTGALMVALDVSAQVERERALRESEARLGVALEATGIGLWGWDLRTGELWWDERMSALHGSKAPEPLERYTDRFVHPDDRAYFTARASRTIETGVWETFAYRIMRDDGSVRWVASRGRVERDETGTLTKVVGGTLDVTEQRLLEEQLRQSQKMEAIGSLTAGIAHNFNNMLSVIMPTLDVVSRMLPKERAPLLRDASHAARRAAEMIQQLMTYAGQSFTYERKPVALDEAVEAAVGICRRVFDRKVQLETSYDGPAPTVVCNPVQIEQVLVNLLLNARDAVLDARPERGLVSIRVRAQSNPLSPEQPGGEPRDAVTLEVEDDGVGMSPELRARLFEPFFTTKGPGRGTGLGLATSFAIVRDHGGTLECRSVAGVGTTFTLRLPTSQLPASRTGSPPKPSPTGGLRVLLIDDDAAVRATVERILSDADLSVIAAGDGAAGVALLQAHPDVDVVLLDRSMPGGAGETFIPRLRAAAPKAKIVFLSGQSVEPSVAQLADGVVAKPASAEALLRTLQRVTQ
jgi:PAS domain S-box-containing protein